MVGAETDAVEGTEIVFVSPRLMNTPWRGEFSPTAAGERGAAMRDRRLITSRGGWMPESEQSEV